MDTLSFSVVRYSCVHCRSRSGRARRRQWQWPVHGWYCWSRCFRAVFPFSVGRPLLPGFMQFLDKAFSLPVRATTGFMVQCRSVRLCSSWTRLVTCPVVFQRPVPRSRQCFRLEAPQLQCIFNVVDFPVGATRLPSCADAAGSPAAHGPDSAEYAFSLAVLGQGC